MRSVKLITLIVSVIVGVQCALVEAQQTKKVPRIGVLSSARPSPMPPLIEAFRQGLRELDYVEGKNILIEYRWAEGTDERYAPLAAELVGLVVDVIVTSGTQATIAAKHATSAIPIIVGGAGDLVGDGVVASLARPGGNVTGFTSIQPDLSAKRLEILKEALPELSRVAVLYHGGPGGDREELAETQTAAKRLGMRVQALQVLEPEQFQRAFASMTKERAQALIIFGGSFTNVHRHTLLDLAAKNRISSMGSSPLWVEAGALVSYGNDLLDQYRRAAGYVDKVLKGTKPADLPVQQPMKFELVVNLKTAKQLGVIVPPQVLARADRIIK